MITQTMATFDKYGKSLTVKNLLKWEVCQWPNVNKNTVSVNGQRTGTDQITNVPTQVNIFGNSYFLWEMYIY